MKNSIKFNVGFKLILAIVLWLPYKAYSAAASENRVFVCACDEGYVVPTAVMIQSLMKTSIMRTNPYPKIVVILLYGVSPENRQLLEDMADEYTTIYGIDLCEEKWKTMLDFSGQPIDLLEIVRGIGGGVFDGVSFENKQNGTDLYRFMVNLRLLLPEIFASQLLPEALRNIDSFLWLDSDLIVYGNLSDLWTIAAAHPNQRMIGVDLHYDHSNPNYLAVAEEVPMELEASSTISGGVVFWDIRQIIEDCRAIRRNVFADTISQIIDSRLDEMGLSLSDGQSAAGIYNYSTEEPVFTKYAYETLRRSAPNEPFCWFPLAYNVAKISHLPFFEGKTDDIVIFHWDSMIKPWDFRATVLRPDYLYTPQAVKLFKKQVRSWIGIAEELNCAIKVRVTF